MDMRSEKYPYRLDVETRLPNGDATYWVWDGIHPTPAGQRLMADCWIGAAARNGVME